MHAECHELTFSYSDCLKAEWTRIGQMCCNRITGSSGCDLFVFSSRRRHTRFDCDWSSDVCSSDLVVNTALAFPTVVVGLLLYGLLSRRGPLGGLGWLYTWQAIVVGDVLIAFPLAAALDRKSTRLNSSHSQKSYAVFCLKKKMTSINNPCLAVWNCIQEPSSTTVSTVYSARAQPTTVTAEPLRQLMIPASARCICAARRP